MRLNRRYLRLRLLGTTLLFLTACTKPPSADEHAIRSLLAERQQALTSRDLPRYRALLSRSYRDQKLDYGAKTAELARTLANWDNIDYQADPPQITISGNSASAATHYRLRVRKQGKTLLMEGEENLRLQREPEGWKIIGGL